MIISPSNEYIKFVRSLKQRKYRDESKRFYIEGGKLIWEALDCGATVERLLFCPELLRSPAEQGIVSRAEGHGIPCAEVDRKVFERISDWDDPDGLGAVVVMRQTRLGDVHPAGAPLVVLLDSISDPGNLGTTIRTAEAAGASAVILLGPCVDLHNPKTVRATMGSFFGIPVIQCADDSEALDWLRAHGMQVIAGVPGAGPVYFEESYLGPTCFVVGNEAHGIRGAILRSCDRSVRIPIVGKADSLNAAVSSALLLYEVVRQRSGGARSPAEAGPVSSQGGGRAAPPAWRQGGRRPGRDHVRSGDDRSRSEGRGGRNRLPMPSTGGVPREADRTGRPVRREATSPAGDRTDRQPREAALRAPWKDEVWPSEERTAGDRWRDETPPSRREQADQAPSRDSARSPGERAGGSRRKVEAERPSRKDGARLPGKKTDRPPRRDEARPPLEKARDSRRREEAGRPSRKEASRPPARETDRPPRRDDSSPRGGKERGPREKQVPADRRRRGGRNSSAPARRSTGQGGDRS